MERYNSATPLMSKVEEESCSEAFLINGNIFNRSDSVKKNHCSRRQSIFHFSLSIYFFFRENLVSDDSLEMAK